MHILITAVDSHEKHGLDGLVIRRETEEEAASELLEWASILAETWELIVVTIVAVGGPYDPNEDGELLSTFAVSGPDRAASLRDQMSWMIKN